jgi:cellulose synthase/poly-beta-1,6-N-acetylglucosamine synthase-like glycosyltransferase
MIFIALFTFLVTCYAGLMLLYRKGWYMQPEFIAGKTGNKFISIIIPARNEEANIGHCIESILEQDYPENLFEIIVVDDHSEDKTVEVVKAFGRNNIKCISLASHIDKTQRTVAYKKKAITAGIAESKGELIVTTDADCIAPPKWLSNISSLYEKHNPVMIIGPVNYMCSSSFLEQFQSLDFMGMQGITVASYRLDLGNMCNGANLAFTRQAFDAVKGYEGMEHIASGDDYLLLTKMQKAFPRRIAYLKSRDAIVGTPPQHDWMSFYRQRIRWASKSGKYGDVRLTAVLVFAYIFNVSILALAIAGYFYPRLFMLSGVMIIIKTVFELVFLYPVAKFYSKPRQLWLAILFQPLHIVYVTFVGLLGFIGKYEWKGRVVK